MRAVVLIRLTARSMTAARSSRGIFERTMRAWNSFFTSSVYVGRAAVTVPRLRRFARNRSRAFAVAPRRRETLRGQTTKGRVGSEHSLDHHHRDPGSRAPRVLHARPLVGPESR